MKKALLLALPFQGRAALCDRRLAEFRSRERLWSTPHLGLLTVGAMLPGDWQVEYVDLSFESPANYDYDYILMSPSTAQAVQAYEIADTVRSPRTKVILGGPHVTMLPQEALAHADVVFAGESEETVREFLRDEASGGAGGLYRCLSPPSLELSPVPRYELAARYPYRSVPVQLSRGCPHQCRFCLSSTIYGRRIRRKSPDQIRAELEVIRSLWARPFLFFTDDNLFINDAFSRTLVSILEEHPVDWYAFTDVSIAEKDWLLDRLYSAGCRKLLIGLESLDPDSLQQLNASGFKRRKRVAYEQAVERIQSRRIGVVGSFVVGLPGDTEETFERLYQFIYSTCLYGTNITVSTPFPGTRMYDDLIAQGVSLSGDWSRYDGFTLLYDLPHLDRASFERCYTRLIERVNSAERLDRVVRYFMRSGQGG